MKLYELTGKMLELEEYVTLAEGKLDPTILEELTALEEKLPTKIEGVCSVIKNLEANAEFAKRESERLSRLHKSREQGAKGLRNYLVHHLQSLERNRIDTPRFTVTIAKNKLSVALQILPTELPERFQRVPPVPQIEADKNGLLAAYEAGEELPQGVHIVEGFSLRIR